MIQIHIRTNENLHPVLGRGQQQSGAWKVLLCLMYRIVLQNPFRHHKPRHHVLIGFLSEVLEIRQGSLNQPKPQHAQRGDASIQQDMGRSCLEAKCCNGFVGGGGIEREAPFYSGNRAESMYRFGCNGPGGIIDV